MKRVTVAALATALSTVLGLAMLAVGAAPAMAAPRAPLSRAARAANPLLGPDGKRPQAIGTNVNSFDCQALGGSYPQPQSQKPPTSTPWAEQALNFRSVWPITEGAGVKVAVVDSGVDDSAQLQGRLTGFDLTGTADDDCVPHGTLVAGIIAASYEPGTGNPFYGVAPAASILSIKVQAESSNQAPNAVDVLAQGIYDAAFLGAQVINVSIQTSQPTAQLAYAVQYALSRNAVIVAAGGNDTPQTGVGPFYPASYTGVLSVGALNPDGSLGDFSDQNSNVQVTAPGVDIVSTSPGGYSEDNGTSFATPFVSGVAALIIASHPGITGPDVVKRIVDTADGNTGPGTGAGMVNPLQAVTALTLPAAAPTAGSTGHPVSVSRALPPDPVTRDTAIVVTVSALGGALLLVISAVVIRQGRRRRWRARPVAAEGMASAPPDPSPAGVPAGAGSPMAPDDSSDIFSERW